MRFGCSGRSPPRSFAISHIQRLQHPPQERGLRLHHARGGGIGAIVVAVEVEQAVDDVEGKLVLDGLAVLARVTGGGGGADNDFAVLEGDDIGGAGEIHETPVDASDGAIGKDADLYLVEPLKRRARSDPLGFARGQRQRGETAQPREINANGPLAIVEVNGARGSHRATPP